ncbi:MAG TPA: carbohydrate kinase family protein [Spirochaetales bacterium]|nr:carbohydrate kinase family protein [Spirochaetales bacterium]HRY53780.1 carbohydrate kinase family protein [Spirochaetia bacterium]HRZ64968.1 carbohydrate kinase family protein [Spirochaetia bacterium]
MDIIPNGFSGFPDKGTERYVESISFSPGGQAIVAAVLALLGEGVELAASRGDDEAGAFLEGELARLGVGRRYLRVSEGATAASLVFAYGGDRSFLTAARRDAGLAGFTAGAVAEACSDGVDRVHVDIELLRDPAVRRACAAARAGGASISVSVGYEEAARWDELSWEIVAGVDTLFLNESEAAMICGEGDVERCLALLRRRTALPVLTLGGEGCASIDEGGGSFRAAARPARAVNACGAGDSFAAAFICGLGRGLGRREAAALAVEVGALAVESPGSVPGGVSPALFDTARGRAAARTGGSR